MTGLATKFCKFVPPGRRTQHLSRGADSGFRTLCGIKFDEFSKKARTIFKLDGDECPKCAKESEWDEWEPLSEHAKSRTRTFRLGKSGSGSV